MKFRQLLFLLVFWLLWIAKPLLVMHELMVASTCFYHSNWRYYDTKVGRFMSADTIVPDPAQGQAFNRYAYTYNNPIKFKDPSGHTPVSNDWLKRAWRRMREGLGWGSSGSSSYGYSQEDFFYEQAMNMNPNKVFQGAAGAAVSTREVEFKTGAAYFAGMADAECYLDPFWLGYNYFTQGVSRPSEGIFEVVILDPASEKGYRIPYGLGVITGVANVVVPVGKATRALGPRRVPASQLGAPPRARPTPGNRRTPQYGEPGYPPVVAGASSRLELPNFGDFPSGTRVIFHLAAGGKYEGHEVLIAEIGLRTGRRTPEGHALVSVLEFILEPPSNKRAYPKFFTVGRTEEIEDEWRLSRAVFSKSDEFTVGDNGKLVFHPLDDEPPKIEYGRFFAKEVDED